jgi:hypothetical protein
MLASGLLSGAVVQTLVRNAADDGDSLFGILGNRKHLVAFTAIGTAHGLIQHDLVREFLLLLWAHLFHLHTRGTWTAFECVDPDRDRAEHLPYCVAAQTTVPTLVRWMLVFEDPRDATIWIAKAVPRAWFEQGRSIAVTRAPTASGPLSFVIASAIEHGVIEARIAMPLRKGRRTMVRLRPPDHRRLRGVEMDGRPWHGFDAERETVELPDTPASEIRFTAYYE